MQLEWIICVALVLVGSQTSRTTCTTNTTTSDTTSTSSGNNSSSAADQLRRDIERLWAPALQAINEAELQRLGKRPHSSSTSSGSSGSSLPQRTNSKRMRWRLNSKLLARRAERGLRKLEPRSITYLSSGPEENSPNPSYIDVKDNEPAPLAWWF